MKLDAASGKEITAQVRTVAGTALAETDFGDAPSSITFGAGQIETTISVPLVDDSENEETEEFTVTLELSLIHI